jgi:hypothetical protein
LVTQKLSTGTFNPTQGTAVVSQKMDLCFLTLLYKPLMHLISLHEENKIEEM